MSDDRARDRRPDALRELLRRGDPAADGLEPSGEELAATRTRTIRAAREAGEVAGPDRPVPLPWIRRPVLAAALVASVLGGALTTGLILWLGGPDGPEPTASVRGTDRADERPAVGSSHPRQVHFTAPGGTRIVWTLYPIAPTALKDSHGEPRAAGDDGRNPERKGTT